MSSLGVILSNTGTGYSASSSTSVTVGIGSQTFVLNARCQYAVGQYVMIASTGSGAWMWGIITAASVTATGSAVVTSVTVNVTETSGSGTHTDWDVNLGGGYPLVGLWNALTLVAFDGWAQVSGTNTVRCRLEIDGVTVRLSGAAKTGNNNSRIFTLPVAFRPANIVYLQAWDSVNAAPCTVQVNTNGTTYVLDSTAGNIAVSLEGFTFPTN